MKEENKNRGKQNKDKPKTLANNLYMLKLAWGFSKGRVLLEFANCFFDYFLWIFYSVIFIQILVEAVSTGRAFTDIALFIGATTLVMLLISLFKTWFDLRYKPMTDRVIAMGMNQSLLDKAAEVEIACYEDTEFYNNYTIAIQEAETRMNTVLSNTANIVFTALSTTFVFIYMFTIDPYVLLFTIFPLIGNFVFGRILSKLYYKRGMDSVGYTRRMDYVNRTIYLQNFAKEIRLSNIYTVLKQIYEEGFSGLLKVYKGYRVKTIVQCLLRDVFTFLFVFQGVFFYGAYRAIISKTISLSQFSVLASAIVNVSWMLIGLSNHISGLMANGLYIAKLKSFLSYEPKLSENADGAVPERESKGLELKQVTFSYKGQDEPVLKDISIRIGSHEKIALVGHNGAGKTTLIKLIMRLYDPESGEIQYNGKDIRVYNLTKYRALFGTAFQDYQIFSMSVAENVLMREVEGDADIDLVRDALKKSGACERVDKLGKGVNTTLTREFDDEGANLSGGESQKIAIARAFAKDFSIAVFDEPSSALDPIAEYKLYQSMMEVCRDKAAIFISHRLSSVIHADRIYMLENGRVVEEGTHQALMALDGKYADMFRKQAEKYVENIA